MLITNHLSYGIVSFVLIISGVERIQALQPADFESEWFLMESQNASYSFAEISHGLGEVPLKVKVLVKPTRGPYQGWIFEARSSQRADDDLTWLYCGVIYGYNLTHVLLFAPIKSTNFAGGRAFCIDSSSWSYGSKSAEVSQTENVVLTKVMAWNASSFPSPDVSTPWKNISTTVPPYFVEISHNLGNEPDLVLLQIRCSLQNPDEVFYTDGIGAGCSLVSKYIAMCGLIYAYSSSHFRVWSPNQGDRDYVACFDDGYGPDNKRYRCSEGEFRLVAWKSVRQQPQEFSFTLNDTIPDMSRLTINIRTWDPVRNYVSVQVKALDGPNSGFIFSGLGQVHRNAYPGSSYGGVVFGYSANSIRIFVPRHKTGTVIHIPENWGDLGHNQTSNRAEITVKIWSFTSPESCFGKQSLSGTFAKTSHLDCFSKQTGNCIASCILDANCVGLNSCTEYGRCQMMNMSIANGRLTEGILGREGELILEKMSCN